MGTVPIFCLRLVCGEKEVSDRLREMIEPVVEALGCELWGIEQLTRGRQPMLRIYIDAAEGINLEDCARVSRQLSSLLDVEDPISGHYTLEVSSPGVARKLFTAEHFSQYAGVKVNLRLKTPWEGSRKYSGQLQGIEGEEVILRRDGEEYLFPIDTIERANIAPEKTLVEGKVSEGEVLEKKAPENTTPAIRD